MDQNQLEELIGEPLYDFTADGGKTYKGGFLNFDQNFHHTDINAYIDELGRRTHIQFIPGTHSQALMFENTVSELKLPLPKNWCVPIPENDTVLYSIGGKLSYLNVGEQGVHWRNDYKVFICFPVTHATPCCVKKKQ